MKLLPAALQKGDYNLAAHILVYGLIKASVENRRKSLTTQRSRNRYGNKRKRQKEE